MRTTIDEKPVDVVDNIIRKILRQEEKLSYSSLSKFKDSPKDFIDYKLGIKKDTAAMIYGSMLHCLVLEEDDFFNRFWPLNDAQIKVEIGGKKPTATKAYKEWKDSQIAMANGRTVVSPEEFRHAQIVAKNVRMNDASARLFWQAEEKEKKIEWEYKNFLFSGFIDFQNDKIRCDLKSMPDAHPLKVQREIISRGLYLQAAMYEIGGGKREFYIIAVDKEGGVSVHHLPRRLIDYGLEEYSILATKFNECVLEEAFSKSYDFWSSRWDGTFEADKPGYLKTLVINND